MNSRYMNEDRLFEIMGSLGYSMAKRKVSSKLAYYLWSLSPANAHELTPKPTSFLKSEVNPGKMRNNFTIVLEP